MLSFDAISRAERPSEREVVFTRRFAAPRALVWRAWTRPELLARWWGPTGFTTTTTEFAFEPGGVWRHMMHGPDGTDYPTCIVFREIDPPARIVYDNGWNLDGAPLDFTVTVTFDEDGDGTRLALRMVYRDAEALRVAVETYGVVQGGVETLDRLAAHLGHAR